ncbi:MAG: YfbK domain-containing protein [Pseudomonadota bacterium]
MKLQLEFNPVTVSEYRLIGYETRILNREDFNNDKVDAGDIGAGHTVTALYEITPAGAEGRLVDDLRYQSEPAKPAAGSAEEYAFMKIRYKLPDSDTSTLITAPVTRGSEAASVAQASLDDRFAASVAAFGQVLGGGRYTGSFSYDDVVSLAQSAKGEDRFGYRAEFINLVRLARSAAALEPQKQ